MAGKFGYLEPILSPDDLIAFVSLSAETADTLAAVC